MQTKKSMHGAWANRWMFVLAATGSAVGLGNIWKFPYITGENGGGAFVLVYLVCILLVGLPIMMAEVLVGRRGRESPMNSMRDVALETGSSSLWRFVGGMGAITGFLIFCFYTVVAGWVLYYVAGMGLGQFEGIDRAGSEAIFTKLISSPGTMIIWYTVFVVLTAMVTAGGVNKGLERASRIMMPLLFVLLVVLLGYATTTGSFGESWHFMFDFNFDKLTWGSVLVAMGHSFFTLSLGMGTMMAYGSYMGKKDSIGSTVLMISVLDTLVALMAGLAIFAVVFANGMNAESGPGLMLNALPVAFGNMPGGQLFGFLFFVMVAFAAWTSAISILEPAAAWVVETFGLSRKKTALILGIIGWVLGLGALLSFSTLSEVKIIDMTIFDFLDFFTANILLPLGGLLTSIFVGWFVTPSISRDELALPKAWLYVAWLFVIRVVSPLAVATIFVAQLVEKFG